MEQFKQFKTTEWIQPILKRDHAKYGISRILGSRNWYISNHGTVKVIYLDINGNEKKVIYPNIHTKGGHPNKKYACLSTQEYIHRLVATAFIPNPESKRTVNHKDMNILNNHIDNLEWSTYSENKLHAIAFKNALKSN